MPPLHRHQLAHLTAAGWQAVQALPWDAQAAACLRHWAAHGLPLVVTRQALPRLGPQAPLALGLAAPLAWQRRRLALQAAPAQIAWFGEFSTLDQALPELPPAERPALRALHADLERLGVRARVYGSAGWQHLTGLTYLHAGSDLDLWCAVDGAEQADRIVARLDRGGGGLRIDGELRFPDGGAVAWREWAAWRAGRCRGVLVKRLDRTALERPGDALPPCWPHAA